MIIILKGKTYLCTFIFVLFFNIAAFAQDSLATYRFDERNLISAPGTTLVNDVTAHRGSALFRPASAVSNTAWYGPYRHLQGGNYLIQFRLKVGSNQSDAVFLKLDVVGLSGSGYNNLLIKPNMFRNSNEWQLFTLPVQVPDDNDAVEIRGISFVSGIADFYLDYVTIIPGDMRGFYSNELTINGKGEVGIGTPDPKGFKLAVNGKIHTQEVQVDMKDWADYVFKPDYNLRSLAELKDYLDRNQHLPDMPSEKMVVRDGIKLGEMNKLLTKKIEELTLYLIEKDRKEKEQEERLNRLEGEILRLKEGKEN